MVQLEGGPFTLRKMVDGLRAYGDALASDRQRRAYALHASAAPPIIKEEGTAGDDQPPPPPPAGELGAPLNRWQLIAGCPCVMDLVRRADSTAEKGVYDLHLGM